MLCTQKQLRHYGRVNKLLRAALVSTVIIRARQYAQESDRVQGLGVASVHRVLRSTWPTL